MMWRLLSPILDGMIAGFILLISVAIVNGITALVLPNNQSISEWWSSKTSGWVGA